MLRKIVENNINDFKYVNPKPRGKEKLNKLYRKK